jgi:hypothetical protein
MNGKYRLWLLLLPVIVIISLASSGGSWTSEQFKGYRVYYKGRDAEKKKEYLSFIDKGIRKATIFFGEPFKSSFDVYIHPDRHSMDSTWQKDWNEPGFQSECWMVASGVAAKIDFLSPGAWGKEACEHSYSDKTATQRLFTHELVHVFHGQQNPSPDFSEISGLDWFVEGLATYASGQCDSSRMSEVRHAIANNSVPLNLDGFWKGNLKYGLSGSMVLYIDKQYGRKKLSELLKYNKKEQVLQSLNTSEDKLLKDWEGFMLL